MPQISLVTVSYNSLPALKTLWASLQNQEVDFEWIIVDNASPKFSPQQCEKAMNDPRVHWIFLDQNLGFGGANNQALSWASAPYTALINPDIVLQKGTLKDLLAWLKKSSQSQLVAPQLENPDGTLQNNARTWPTLWQMIQRRLSPKKEKSPPHRPMEVNWLQGSFLVAKTNLFRETLQGFDERFFLFLEDTDLCRRCWEQGCSVYLLPHIRATHGADRLSGTDFWQAMTRKRFGFM